MEWYLVKIIYKINCGNRRHTPQFDEQMRLFKASSSKHAWEKAIELGKKGENIFRNHKLELVKWEFTDVPGLYLVGDLYDGVELLSDIAEPEKPGAYTDLTYLKSNFL